MTWHDMIKTRRATTLGRPVEEFTKIEDSARNGWGGKVIILLSTKFMLIPGRI